MTTLSINLPDQLAKASQIVAGSMGISRSEFIRLAVAHELKAYQARIEEKAVVDSMLAMKLSKAYQKEIEQLMGDVGSDLPDDKDAWWKKK
jgi:metal-responsive CopG/Arc/MetJ family transcriptional regulator